VSPAHTEVFPRSLPTSPIEAHIRLVWLGFVWLQNIKQEMKRDADPELSQLLDEVSYEDLLASDNNDFFQRLAAAKLGPYLAAMGLDQDPLAFFSEVYACVYVYLKQACECTVNGNTVRYGCMAFSLRF